IYWFSIFNSFMMVILTGLVSMILMRTLRNGYAKYAREDDDSETLERDISEEFGWKLVHGDVKLDKDNDTNSLPFPILMVWHWFLSFGLLSPSLFALLGTVVGCNWSGSPNNPCQVKTIPRPFPEKKWYLSPSVIFLRGGLLPFGSLFIEMYFAFTPFWNYKVYYVYGFILLVFLILVIVTVCVMIVGMYFLLNAENYHRQWTSFLSTASTAIYVYLYAVYYYH
ncbi:Transmembrane 9 superfamily member 1, partial [Bienertia sinuspersici]